MYNPASVDYNPSVFKKELWIRDHIHENVHEMAPGKNSPDRNSKGTYSHQSVGASLIKIPMIP